LLDFQHWGCECRAQAPGECFVVLKRGFLGLLAFHDHRCKCKEDALWEGSTASFLGFFRCFPFLGTTQLPPISFFPENTLREKIPAYDEAAQEETKSAWIRTNTCKRPHMDENMETKCILEDTSKR